MIGLALASLLLAGFGTHADHDHMSASSAEIAAGHADCPPGPDHDGSGCAAMPGAAAAHATCCVLPVGHAEIMAPAGTVPRPPSACASASLSAAPPSRPPRASSVG